MRHLERFPRESGETKREDKQGPLKIVLIVQPEESLRLE